MEYKKIGIDLDNTIFSCNSLTYSWVSKIAFQNEKKIKHFDVNQKAGIKYTLANKIFKMFNPKKYKEYPGAIETINYLFDKGYGIYFVSSRPNIRPCHAMILGWLEKHNVKYDKLILGCNNKSAYAFAEGIDYFIDDMKKICKTMEDVGIESLMFKGKLKQTGNKKFRRNNGEKIVDSWDDVKEYFDNVNKIENYEENC